MILETTKNLTMKIGGVVDIQSNYKITQLKVEKDISISLDSQISAHMLAVLHKFTQRNLEVSRIIRF